jgi:hypothetical protein
VRPRFRIAPRSPASVLGCTSETGCEFPGLLFRAARLLALRRVIACGAPGFHQALLHFPTPPEFHLPSGGVIAGVRSSRAYLPRHLPPLTFLKPSTVCTSSQLACLLSYRHHLWDSKNTNGSLRLIFLTGPSEDGPVRDDEARTLPTSKDDGNGIALLAREVALRSLKPALRMDCLRDTHPIFCKQSFGEEDTATNSSLRLP